MDESQKHRSELRKLLELGEEFLTDLWGVGSIWRFFRREAASARKSWAIIVVVGGVCFVTGYWCKGKLSNNSKASLPDVNSSEINRMREEGEREWPPLTDKQVKEWANALTPFCAKNTVLVVCWSQDVEAKRFFWSLQKVGKLMGIAVQNWGGSADGDEIIVDDRSFGRVLVDLLNTNGYPAKLNTGQLSYISPYVTVYIPARPETMME